VDGEEAEIGVDVGIADVLLDITVADLAERVQVETGETAEIACAVPISFRQLAQSTFLVVWVSAVDSQPPQM
jgi:hypothetical protein